MFHFKGSVEKEIGGKVVNFKFNMAALSYFGDLQNLTIRQIGDALQDPKFSTIADFLYAGAVTYCKQEKKKQDFTREDALQWLDELGLEECGNILAQALQTPAEKNQAAPE